MWHGRPRHTASRMESSTGSDQTMYPCAASPGSKERNCWKIYTAETVDIIHHHGPSSARRSVVGFIGPPHSMTPSN